MSDIRVLVVDGDANIRKKITQAALEEGYVADEAEDGIAALKLFRRNEYNIVILDTFLPELDGSNVCRQIRKVSDIPIIIVSSEGAVESKISAFELLADDYLTKPFYVSELMARVKVFLRRGNTNANIHSNRISFNGLFIDIVSRTVYINEKSVKLTPKEFELLLFLSGNPNKAYSRDFLLSEIWGQDFFGSDRTVDTHIKTLRARIKPFGHYVATVWGYGYKFDAEDNRVANLSKNI